MSEESGQVALVTGASGGIGKATVARLLEKGFVVYAAARRVEEMQDLVRKGAIVLHLDLLREDSIVAVAEEIDREKGCIDVLVNNAGYGVYGSVEDTLLEDARAQFEVNLFGLARLTQLLLPMMRKRGAGTIVNVSSMGGKVHTPLGAWYHASKYALEGWSDCLRLELEPFGVRVVIVQPGAIETGFPDVMMGPMMKRSAGTAYSGMAKAMRHATLNTFESGKASPPEVIADVIETAVSARRPKTRYVAGHMAKPVLFLRRWLSDRVFDAMLRLGLR